MTSADGRDYVLMSGDDPFSRSARAELRARGIDFGELDVAAVADVVRPTLVVRGGCPAGDVAYEGLGRIKGEFLVRYDASPRAHGPAPAGRPARAR